MPSIVTLDVSEQLAPSPNTLQQQAAFPSTGGTNLAPGTLQLLTQETDLATYLLPPLALATLTQVGGLATATLASGTWGIPVATVLNMTISGATPAAYNGTFSCTINTTAAF